MKSTHANSDPEDECNEQIHEVHKSGIYEFRPQERSYANQGAEDERP